MIKKFFYSGFLVVALVVSAYIFAVYKNNKAIPAIDKIELQSRLESSIVWLVNNEEKIIEEANVMLWWILYEAHKLSGDKRLSILLEGYHERYKNISLSLWGPLFGGRKMPYVHSNSLKGMPYYNLHFIYALNCASNLEYELPVVGQQNKSNFCHQSAYFYRPACITHQLMGLNFIKNQSCSGVKNLDQNISDLQSDIINQLTWDVRVVDVYLQRVMMLLITGKGDKVKPIWLRQILDHQLNDGGWGDFDAKISLAGNQSLGFGPRMILINTEQSTFHATAQSVYILTMLTKTSQELPKQ